MTGKIAVAQPVILGNEREYLLQAFDARQFSGGAFLARFEQAFAGWLGVKHAIAVSSGTAALHLALLAAGVGPGDEVLVPDLAFVAVANAVTYCGAQPVMVDVAQSDWNIQPDLAEAAITPRTKAIIAVHLYGAPADMDALREIAKRRGLALIEDAAEALGSEFGGQKVGGLGDIGCFSFYANKTIMSGEGGMVVTDDDDAAEQVRLLRGQGQQPNEPYWHNVIGFNYRMTEMQAALGLAQLERVDEHLRLRRQVCGWYLEEHLDATYEPQDHHYRSAPAYWMVAVQGWQPLYGLGAALRENGIETRPFFTPLHMLPPYISPTPMPVSTHLWRHGIVLPTHAALTEADVERICEVIFNWDRLWSKFAPK